MTATEKIKTIQSTLEVAPDGKFGPISFAALNKAIITADSTAAIRTGLASSFADPRDVAAFKRCKATGKSDQECFRVGDNGIGCWGDPTTGPVPMCALPPEDWRPLGSAARGAKVAVTISGKTVVCELRDTMPAQRNIKNGAIIDLSPAAGAAFGLRPPFMVPCSWRWA